MFCRDGGRNTIGDYRIPKHLTDQNTLEILIENMKKMDTEQQQINTSKCDFCIKNWQCYVYYWCKKNQTNILIQ